MNWFAPKCPVDAEEKAWLEESLRWLADEFGVETWRSAQVILPTEEFFPDPYHADEAGAHALVKRVCGYMGVDYDRLELEFYDDEEARLREHLPAYESAGSGAAGHYRRRRGKFVISLAASQLDDPMNMVATFAHELGHVLLLGGGRVSARYEDQEPLTDLLTIFLGFGIFTGNTAFTFSQWRNAFSAGWSYARHGYLTEEALGYALALFAWVRGEQKPAWARHLQGNVSAYFKSSLKYLSKTGDTTLRELRLN